MNTDNRRGPPMTDLPPEVEQLTDTIQTFLDARASEYDAEDSQYALDSLRAYLAHQRAVVEAMAKWMYVNFGNDCGGCVAQDECKQDWKKRSSDDCAVDILAHLEAQVKGGSK